MVWIILALNTRIRFSEGKFVGVDRLRVGDDPGDGAQAGGDARVSGGHEPWQRVGEHCRVELIGLPINIQVNAWKQSTQNWRLTIGMFIIKN